jgi:carbamoyltransferase
MDFLINVGNLSSAIAVKDGKIIAGYEEEKISRVKADNSFPILAIGELIKHVKPDKINRLFRSDDLNYFEKELPAKSAFQLYPSSQLSGEEDGFNQIMRPFLKRLNKRIDLIKKLQQCEFEIYKKTEKFTHHDMHAESVRLFSGKENFDVMVADRVGDNDETITVYRNGEVIYKEKNESRSIGTMFQEACIFCGWQPDVDEGKFQAYYTKFQRHPSDMFYIEQESQRLIEKDIPFSDIFSRYSNGFKIEDRRKVVGYIIQSYAEKKILNIIKDLEIENLLLAGGVFYNVELNRKILNTIKGQLSVMPLAGDTGAALGLYKHHCGYIDMGDLCWGKRDLNGMKRDAFVDLIVEYLRQNRIINVLTGGLEFGPRALCNTTTLALPTYENVGIINRMNKRDSNMPLAPVLLEKNLPYFFKPEQYERIIKSDEFMIVSYDYKDDVPLRYEGIKHAISDEICTGRPQVIRNENHYMYEVLTRAEKELGVKALINTSFNIHGKPIVFDMNDAEADYKFQRKREDRVVLLVCEE